MEKLERAKSKALDEILGKEFKVLDQGFVRAIDYMGNDSAIVQAARTSYGKGTKSVSEDRALIKYLMRHRHTSPFEMCELKLHVKVPMDAWRQWIRHRTASVNEYSTRYSEAIDEKKQTLPNEWRQQNYVNKQGSEGFLEEKIGKKLSRKEEKFHKQAEKVYKERIAKGVSREQARKDLPLSTYTIAYWKIDLHNLLHFSRLRMDEKAQLEIREYANVIGNEIIQRWVPSVWEAFQEYSLTSINLSAKELVANRLIMKGMPLEEAVKNAKITNKFEAREAVEKFKEIYQDE
tara:strand:- start:490 stop:1362 length:873 start_codon:yes stop_codon:yes gene_type:complete